MEWLIAVPLLALAGYLLHLYRRSLFELAATREERDEARSECAAAQERAAGAEAQLRRVEPYLKLANTVDAARQAVAAAKRQADSRGG